MNPTSTSLPKHFCALLFLPSILAAQTSAVSGRWFATVDFHGTPLYFNMKLEQRGAAITGQFGGDKLESAINGESIRFLARDPRGVRRS